MKSGMHINLELICIKIIGINGYGMGHTGKNKIISITGPARNFGPGIIAKGV